MTSANIDHVRQLIQDPHLTIQRVSTLPSISYGSANTVLHDHLHMKKVCARWTPHQLGDEQEETESAPEMTDIFDRAGRLGLGDIVTGDEKCFNVYVDCRPLRVL